MTSDIINILLKMLLKCLKAVLKGTGRNSYGFDGMEGADMIEEEAPFI